MVLLIFWYCVYLSELSRNSKGFLEHSSLVFAFPLPKTAFSIKKGKKREKEKRR